MGSVKKLFAGDLVVIQNVHYSNPRDPKLPLLATVDCSMSGFYLKKHWEMIETNPNTGEVRFPNRDFDLPEIVDNFKIYVVVITFDREYSQMVHKKSKIVYEADSVSPFYHQRNTEIENINKPEFGRYTIVKISTKVSKFMGAKNEPIVFQLRPTDPTRGSLNIGYKELMEKYDICYD